jgi:two-component system, LytTR family, response regulator
MSAITSKKNQGPFLTIKRGSDSHTVSINNIVYCNSDANFSKLMLTDGRVMLFPGTLKSLESLLSAARFFRLNRSLLINMVHVKLIINDKGCHIIMSDHSVFEVPKSKQALLFSAFQ